MFSVKWQYYREDGAFIEQVFEAERVAYAADQRTLPPEKLELLQFMDRDVAPAVLVMGADDGAPRYSGRSFNFGKFYVMNEHGKTVATYDLGAAPPLMTTEVPRDGGFYQQYSTTPPAEARAEGMAGSAGWAEMKMPGGEQQL